MRSAALWASSAALVAACGTAPAPAPPEPVVRTVTVSVEVPTKCIKQAPARPAVRAPQEIAREPAGRGIVELGASYADLWDYAGRWEAVAAPCVAGDNSLR